MKRLERSRDPTSFPVVLASDSPRRREMIRAAGIAFSPCSCPTREKSFPGRPSLTVRSNAEAKAREAEKLRPEALIIAADTIVYLRRVFGKPANLREAERMLLSLSGKTHAVYSAVTVSLPARGGRVTRIATTRVRMKPLDRRAVRAYFRKVNPLDKAGAYAIQEQGEMIVEGIAGSLSNVIGLPLEALEEALNAAPGGKTLAGRIARLRKGFREWGKSQKSEVRRQK
ncbi:MAG: Maf family protein [Candidatus Aureabacteria bacterium]|nr:Maf family protein [Candidatus Auribacterota bacterium]